MSSKLIRKALSFVLAFITVLCLVPSFHKADAATVNWPSLSANGYCLFNAEGDKKITTYQDEACKVEKGYFKKATNSKIIKFSARYYTFQVKYLTSSGTTVTRWAKNIDMFGISNPTNIKRVNIYASNTKSATDVKAKTYYTLSDAVNGNSCGYLEPPKPNKNQNHTPGDTVYVLNQKTASNGKKYTRIIYTAKNGSRAYKLAWILTANLTRVTKKLSIVDVAIHEKDNSNVYYNGAWCVAFARFCAFAIGCDDTNYPMNDINKYSGSNGPILSCSFMINNYLKKRKTPNGESQWVGGTNVTPEPGWLIFFDWEADDKTKEGYGEPNHVGIVKEVKNGNVYYIDGNGSSSDQHVRERYKAKNSIYIYGYGRPTYPNN